MKKKKLSLAEKILALLFGATILIVLMQVLFRYGFNNSLTWSEELSRYLFTWIIFLGAACALSGRAHIRIESLVNMLPEKQKRFVHIFNRVVIILFIELVIVLGFALVRHTAGTQSPALSLPVNIVYYSSLPVAFLIGLFYEIRNLLREPDSNASSKAGESMS